MSDVKKHFEDEAKEYDDLILKLIPNYKEMVTSLIACIPFETSKPIKVLDLGCGTGNISRGVKERYPHACITCIDLAENMIDLARFKLSKYDKINYYVADFSDFEFDNDYDLVISSLALHHLKTDDEKIGVYSRIYDALRDGGVFYNADNILGSNKYLENVNQNQWKKFMLKTITPDEIEGRWLPSYYKEDHPAPLIKHVDWLRKVGFKDVDVVWKYIIGAVFGGVK